MVGRFVEFFGAGLTGLGLADRATIANMSPEYGATTGFFPVDDETLRYLRMTGRPDEQIDLVERYCKEQGLFRTDDDARPGLQRTCSSSNLDTIQPSVAGPRRPQDRVRARRRQGHLPRRLSRIEFPTSNGKRNGHRPAGRRTGIDLGELDDREIGHGSVAIAAITSCTNTSNPSVMVGAGLLAKKAVERGLDVAPYVKTSPRARFAGGDAAISTQSGLTGYLEALGFHTVGYGCTTCIGNSGPLPVKVAEAVDDNELVVAAVLSGNRNFEGRVHQQVRAAFLASPPLVVAYALAGTVDIDLTTEPLGIDPNGQAGFPQATSGRRRRRSRARSPSTSPRTCSARNTRRSSTATSAGRCSRFRPASSTSGIRESTYVQEPPYFIDMAHGAGARCRTSPARACWCWSATRSRPTTSRRPARSRRRARPRDYLINNDVNPKDFNSYGSRRGNHEVMVRGTFANIRLRNQLVPGKEGNLTLHLPTGEEMSIFDASIPLPARRASP